MDEFHTLLRGAASFPGPPSSRRLSVEKKRKESMETCLLRGRCLSLSQSASVMKREHIHEILNLSRISIQFVSSAQFLSEYTK